MKTRCVGVLALGLVGLLAACSDGRAQDQDKKKEEASIPVEIAAAIVLAALILVIICCIWIMTRTASDEWP